MKEKGKQIFLFFIPLLVGIISSFFVDKNFYHSIHVPSLAPPPIVFPIVWTILYLLMGIILLRIYKTNKKDQLFIFILQLFLNFLWVVLFFQAKWFFVSFLLLILLDTIVLYLTLLIKKTDQLSFYLLLPYMFWLYFASYLNWAIFLLN